MKKIFTLFLFSNIICTLFAQIRYKDDVFSITRHADIEYGSNYDNKNQLTHLLLDVYEPEGDTAKLRPLIVFIHGGSFKGGDREDQSINKSAEFFARKGYVTANIEYRLQQTTFIDPIIDFADTYQWYRAIVRATQDLKAAIRYFKKDAAINGNIYKIDTSTIFIYGSSAGAITALHSVYLRDTIDMSSLFKITYNELGCLEGNSGNPGYSSTNGIKAIVSCSGALEDLRYMNGKKDIQYLGFHNNPDFTVPYGEGCFVTVACWLGTYYGDSKIIDRVKKIGAYGEFYPVNEAGHPVDQTKDTASRRMILEKTTDFLYRITSPSIPTFVRNNIAKNIELFPNPTDGNLNITMPKILQNKESILEIYSIDGTLVYSEKIKNKEIVQLNLTIADGMYFLSLKNDTENYLSKITILK